MQSQPNSTPPPAHSPARSKSPAVFLATGFGAGLVFPAPGTIGAAMGSLLAWGISFLPGPLWQLVAIAAGIVIGVPLCTAAGHALGGKKDNQAIIWDEIASMPLVFLFVPIGAFASGGWLTLLAGFALHRLFDITKPPPARQLEYLPEGLGVMADDCMAALYAAGSLFLLAKYALPMAA
jgi:phosphatidylglycerophosphatase A